MKFRTTVELGGKTATGFRVPEEVIAALGKGKRPPVLVTVGGHTYRSTVAVMNEAFMVPLSAENREAAGVRAGDEVDVEIDLDSEPRQVTVPLDLEEALDADARRRFDALSYSNQRRIVMSIEDAKTPDTRRRRIDKALTTLRSNDV